MRLRITVCLLAALVAVPALAGCAQQGDPARFIRYERLPDGRLAALIEWKATGASAQEWALSRFTDLRAGDIVMVGRVGRDWDQPQWMPQSVILSGPTH